jgi:adenosylcobinamide kinase/adenosylcobinamide-phosphate guanylyltransferase
MSHVTLVTGGAGSGKSRYACDRAAKLGPKVLFVATCEVRDDEMRAKVARHQAERPPSWKTVEATRDVAGSLLKGFDAAVVDCLTLLISQMLVAGAAESDILGEVGRLCESPPYPMFVVTNEVGWGIVPDNELARRFREIAGRANRLAASRADEVVLLVSGIPVPIKGAPWKS